MEKCEKREVGGGGCQEWVYLSREIENAFLRGKNVKNVKSYKAQRK